ncbi:PilW family protein [Acinetobacter sp. A2]|uniref:PilW family protein n=1 Tax=Acinetobacter sp. A2 TaxID=362457 RepID=UPI003AF39589
MNKIQGFTLIELMISLALGLILVAIAMQLILSGQSNYRIQQAAATIQDSGVFSLNAVTKNIRLANHGNAGAINDETLYGGIVLSAQSAKNITPVRDGNLNNLKVGGTLLNSASAISASENDASGFGSLNSDQLVIIYQAPMQMFTCTGRTAQGPQRTVDTTEGSIKLYKGWFVVERYYIKKNTATNSADLYCADAMFLAKGEEILAGSGWTATEVLDRDYSQLSGELVAPNVDYMHVQLNVRNSDGTYGTMSIADYQSLPVTTTTQRPSITGINIGWLVRSSQKLPSLDVRPYQVLDTTLTPPDDKYMRHVYTTSVALRNGGVGVMP